MRTYTLVASLATLLVCLACVVSATPNTDKETSELLARALKGQVDSDTLIQLEKRQAAAGGGGGTPTTYTGVQTISGYTPPPSRTPPEPVVSAGTSVLPNQIPGYGNQSTNSSSGAIQNTSAGILIPLLGTAMAIFMAGGAGWAFL